ncbi:hypothetical protein Tco_1467406, partial [Tanacetum coccineum]
MDNLFNRNCSSSSTCPICQSCVETIEHLLFEWFDKDASCILSTVATICWSIWKAHNSFVYESTVISPYSTLALVNAQLLEFDRVVTTKQPVCNRPTSQSSPGWIPPHSPLVKINCDAAFKDSTAAIAIVGRDSSGSILHVYGTPCYAFSPLHAEIFAIHSACHLALCRGLGSINGIRAFALRNFDLEVMKFESAQSNTTAKLPILKL